MRQVVTLRLRRAANADLRLGGMHGGALVGA